MPMHTPCMAPPMGLWEESGAMIPPAPNWGVLSETLISAFSFLAYGAGLADDASHAAGLFLSLCSYSWQRS
jgi:hypothetical protein